MNKLEKKGLQGVFMDPYNDFLIFEPSNETILWNFIYEIVEFNKSAYREKIQN